MTTINYDCNIRLISLLLVIIGSIGCLFTKLSIIIVFIGALTLIKIKRQ